MAELLIKDVTKVYPSGIEAVSKANLKIADGEFVVLVGPSGCGKTTTLYLIAGLENITSGTISIGNKIVNDVPPKDRDIAMVFQNYALYPHMTVYNNLAFGLKMRKFKKTDIDQKVNTVARLLDITDCLSRKPSALSGGQRQRVALGRAIVREPKAFLFDEPLSNLDAKLRSLMRAQLKQLHQRLKTTTVYVTHDQEEAMSLGDQIVVMHQGSIRQIGRPLDVYDNPVDRFVAGFIGMPPMNFIDGTVKKQNNALVFEMIGQTLRIPPIIADKLNSYIGQNLTLGARPEHLWPAEPEKISEPEATIEMNVTIAEPLGSNQDIYLKFGNQTVISRCDAHVNVAIGSKCPIMFDLDRIHFFESGELGVNVILERKITGVGA